MNLALRIGLIILGVGLLSTLGFVITSSSWGPCGPSGPAPLIFGLAALFCLPSGVIFSAVGVLNRKGKDSQAPIEPH
jgi:hypothetical protein